MGASTRTYWPSMSDYQEAVQSPQVCFSDKDLKAGSPVLTALGLPRPICGAFASVYELEQSGKRWAVKCFLRNIPDQHKRYAKISSCIHSCGLPYFVTFDYLSDAILVQGKKFPLVKMEWVEADALNQYVVANLKSPSALRDLEARWLQLLEDLKSKTIAHGDLQHGNVLVDPSGNLRLIDYDGMWVPSLKGEESHETGHADYQSPYRGAKDFHEDIDQFSGIVIRIALRALAEKPDLWQKYDNGENLLLKRQDYVDPHNSDAFAELQGLGDPEICEGLDVLRALCSGGKKAPKARDKKKADKKRAAEEKRHEDDKRRANEKRAAEQKRREDEKRQAHEKRLADEKQRAEEKRLAKEKRRDEHNKRMAEQKRRADEKKRAQKAKATKAAPAAAPKPAASGPSWMQDHAPGFGTARPAAPARSRKTQKAKRSKGPATPPPPPAPKPAKPAKAARPAKAAKAARPARTGGQAAESTCGLHHLIVHVIAVAPALYLGLEAQMDILRWASWVIVGMACISLFTRLTLRGLHRGASTAFFGLTGLAILGNTVFELCTMGSYGNTTTDIVQYGARSLLLVASIAGILMGRRMQC